MRCCKEHGHENCTHPSHEIRALRAEVERLTKERDGWQRAAESQNRQWAQKCEQATELRAEVERLRVRLEIDPGGSDKIDELSDALMYARAEIERLRGLIAETEWVSGGYIMGPPSCPWCDSDGGDTDGDWHYSDCSAFSARGEVRR